MMTVISDISIKADIVTTLFSNGCVHGMVVVDGVDKYIRTSRIVDIAGDVVLTSSGSYYKLKPFIDRGKFEDIISEINAYVAICKSSDKSNDTA